MRRKRSKNKTDQRRDVAFEILVSFFHEITLYVQRTHSYSILEWGDQRSTLSLGDIQPSGLLEQLRWRPVSVHFLELSCSILFNLLFLTTRLLIISDIRQLSLWHSTETNPGPIIGIWEIMEIWKGERLTANCRAIRLWFVRKRAPMGSEWEESWWEDRRAPG